MKHIIKKIYFQVCVVQLPIGGSPRNRWEDSLDAAIQVPMEKTACALDIATSVYQLHCVQLLYMPGALAVKYCEKDIVPLIRMPI